MCGAFRSSPPPSWEATRGENYVSRARLGHLRAGNHPHSPSGSNVNPDTTGCRLSPFSFPQGKGADTDSRTRIPYPPPHSRPQWLTLCHSGVRVWVPTAQAGRRNPGPRAQEGKCFLPPPPVCQISLLCSHRPECPAPSAHRPRAQQVSNLQLKD